MIDVEVDELVVTYGDVFAVNGVSFSARAGEVTVVLGPNGAGKTSTIECIEGIRRPSSGRVSVGGLDPQRDAARLRPRMGVMLQQAGVPTGQRVIEAIRQYAAFYAEPQPVDELVALVGLEHRRSAVWRRLSGGEQQRLSLALALVGRPDVVFLDEPTAGIDPEGRVAIRDIVAGLRSGGATVLLTTHDLDEAERLADRIVIIDQGRVVAEGRPEELLHDARAGRIRFTAAGGLDVGALGAQLGCRVLEPRGGEYEVELDPSPGNVARLAGALADACIELGELRAGRRRLDDLFRELTTGPHTGEEGGSAPVAETPGLDHNADHRQGAKS